MTSSNSKRPPPAACHLQIANTSANPSPSSPIAHSSSSSSSGAARSSRATTGTGVVASGSGSGSGQNQACAACKYQRRKCNPDCPLAPYFPADQQSRFLHAHRLFGVGHIQATLRETPPELHTDAMRALIFQAEARAQDPVGGCCRIVLNYEMALAHAKAERNTLLGLLDRYRHQAAAAAQDALVDDPGGMPLLAPGPNVLDDVHALYAGQEIYNGQANLADHYLVGAADQLQPQPYQMMHNLNFFYDGTAGDEASSHAWSNADNVEQPYGNGVNAGSPVALGDQMETQFVDVKPQIAGAAAVMEHDAGSDMGFHQLRLEHKVVVKNELLDHRAAAQMAAAESAAAAASRCQLELGVSSL